MKYITFLSLFMASLSCAPARAHDFWIEPASFRAAPGSKVPIALRVGQDFRGDAVPFVPKFFSRFVYRDPDGTEHPVAGNLGDDPAGSLVFARAGLYLVGYRSNRQAVSLAPEKFESYLRDEGLEAIIAERARRGESGRDGRELYSRCAKALLRSAPGGGGGQDRPLDFTLELLPEADPYALAAGATLPVRLLYEGAPLPGALVVAFRRDDPARKSSARTDAAGRVALPLAHPGVWLVKAVHMVRLPAGGDHDWESTWASLTFELPG